MTSRERMLAALRCEKPDVLPVTTHHVMPYFLNKYEGGISIREFFDKFGFDAINWFVSQIPDEKNGEYVDKSQGKCEFLEAPRIMSDNWIYKSYELSDPQYKTVRFDIITPKKTLSMVLQSNEYTTWIMEHPIKEKSDI